MKFGLQFFAILILAFFLELFLPWWGIAIAAFTGGALLKSKANFLAGCSSIALLWLIKAWMIDFSTTSSLAEKVSNIFPLHSKPLLFLLMALLGGLVGGFAALTGSLLKKKQAKRNYSASKINS